MSNANALCALKSDFHKFFLSYRYLKGRGGHTPRLVRGREGSQFGRLEKSLVLYLLRAIFSLEGYGYRQYQNYTYSHNSISPQVSSWHSRCGCSWSVQQSWPPTGRWHSRGDCSVSDLDKDDIYGLLNVATGINFSTLSNWYFGPYRCL